MDTLLLFISFIIAFSVVCFLWLNGHSGAWAKLANTYPITESKIKSDDFNNNVEFAPSYFGGFNSVNIEVANDGICICASKWFRWAYPPFLIPWSQINSISLEQGAAIKQTAISINDISETMYIPGKYYGKCQSYIEDFRTT